MFIAFQVHNAISETSIDKYFEAFAAIDPSLPTKMRSKKLAKTDLASRDEYKAYKKKHCFERQYAFQVKL